MVIKIKLRFLQKEATSIWLRLLNQWRGSALPSERQIREESCFQMSKCTTITISSWHPSAELKEIYLEQSCWRQLFKCAVIVDRPVARRGEEAGLDMSFEDMVEIAGVVLEWEIESTAVLLGYSTLLVSTKRSSEGIHWHLEPWGADSKDNLLSTVQGYEERLKEDLANLRNERAFLG
jgi:hypothetical protein